MPARLSAFVIWALIAATVVFWALRLAVHAPPAPPHVVALGDAVSAGVDLTRLFGAPPVESLAAAAAPEASSRFKLLGIMASKPRRADAADGGLALIAVDGKPARAYRVGSHLDDDLVLQSVSLRTASIGPATGSQSLVLEIPRLAPAATGTLGRAGIPAPTAQPMPVPAGEAAQPQDAAPAMANPQGPVTQRDVGNQTQ